jgi:glycosyltransferase involved in cell wall biosynthesis
VSTLRILHLITGLNAAGAETALVQLCRALDPARFDVRIVCLKAEPAAIAAFQAQCGWPVESLGLRGPLDAPRAVLTVRRMLKAFGPDIVQSWLYHADLLARLTRSAVPDARLIWSLRNASLQAEGRWDWAALTGSLARLSGGVDLVIANAEAPLLDHRVLGYRPRATRVIPNGWPVPEPVSADVRAVARGRLQLTQEQVAILLPARLARQKDHPTYLAAARLATDAEPRLAFLAAGQGVSQEALARLGPGSPVIALGERADVTTLMSAVDAVTLTSAYGEGCPNGLGEAMARAVPVIATTAGGVRELVGDCGLTVAPRDAHALADAYVAFARLAPAARTALGAAGQRRVEAHFSFDRFVSDHVRAYQALVEGTRGPDR